MVKKVFYEHDSANELSTYISEDGKLTILLEDTDRDLTLYRYFEFQDKSDALEFIDEFRRLICKLDK